MTLPTITALPTAPARTDPSTFAARGDAFVAALATLRSEINAWGSALPAELAPYAPLASPAFTGTPTLPTGTVGVTQAAADASTKLATTAFVGGELIGAWKRLRSQTAAGDVALNFVNGSGGVVISAAYDDYWLHFSKLKVSTDNASVYMRYSTNGGASYNSGATNYVTQALRAVSSSAVATLTTSGEFRLSFEGLGNVAASEDGLSGDIFFSKPADIERFSVHGRVMYLDTLSQLCVSMLAGRTDTDEDVDAVQILPSAGNFSSGEITLYARRRT